MNAKFSFIISVLHSLQSVLRNANFNIFKNFCTQEHATFFWCDFCVHRSKIVFLEAEVCLVRLREGHELVKKSRRLAPLVCKRAVSNIWAIGHRFDADLICMRKTLNCSLHTHTHGNGHQTTRSYYERTFKISCPCRATT